MNSDRISGPASNPFNLPGSGQHQILFPSGFKKNQTAGHATESKDCHGGASHDASDQSPQSDARSRCEPNAKPSAALFLVQRWSFFPWCGVGGEVTREQILQYADAVNNHAAPSRRGDTSPRNLPAAVSSPTWASFEPPVELSVIRADQAHRVRYGLQLLAQPIRIIFEPSTTLVKASKDILRCTGLAFEDAHQIEGIRIKCFHVLRGQWVPLLRTLEW